IVRHNPTKERQEDVEGLGRRRRDEHVAFDNPAELRRAGDAPGRTFINTLARGEPIQDFFLVLSLGTSKEVTQGNEDGTHDARNRGGEGGGVRGGGLWPGKAGWNILGGVGGPVWAAFGEFLWGGAAGAGHQRAHLIGARVQHLLRPGDAAAPRASPSRRKRRT